MAKFIVTSDWHLHNWKYSSRKLNSQEYCVDVLYDICIKQNIKNVFFCGDFFHVPNKIDNDVLLSAKEIIDEFHRSNISLHVIPGNHDFNLKEAYMTPLYLYKDKINLHATPGYKKIEEIGTVLFVPYQSDKKFFTKIIEDNKDVDYMFLHQGVLGSPVGSDFVLKDEILEPSMIPARVKHAFTGHYHTHKRVSNNLTIVGSLSQYNWGDADTDKGFLIYDTNKEDYDFFKVNSTLLFKKYPCDFIKLNLGMKNYDLLKQEIWRNFVRVEGDMSSSEMKEIREELITLGAESVEFKVVRKEKKSELVGTSFNIEQVLEEWEKENEIDQKKKEIGKEIRKGSYEVF